MMLERLIDRLLEEGAEFLAMEDALRVWQSGSR